MMRLICSLKSVRSSLDMSEGLVVIPAGKPRLSASSISTRFAESTKIFIPPSPNFLPPDHLPEFECALRALCARRRLLSSAPLRLVSYVAAALTRARQARLPPPWDRERDLEMDTETEPKQSQTHLSDSHFI